VRRFHGLFIVRPIEPAMPTFSTHSVIVALIVPVVAVRLSNGTPVLGGIRKQAGGGMTRHWRPDDMPGWLCGRGGQSVAAPALSKGRTYHVGDKPTLSRAHRATMVLWVTKVHSICTDIYIGAVCAISIAPLRFKWCWPDGSTPDVHRGF
jgi:hypothetical protein